MQLFLQDNLLFTNIMIAYQTATLEVNHVLIDTGSASTILSADIVEAIAIFPEPEDTLHIVRGVGGSEVVFEKRLDYLQIGSHRIERFAVEVGAMDYGFAIHGILGMDFLVQAGAVLDLNKMQIKFAQSNS
jgi:predicted aspartyl protease